MTKTRKISPIHFLFALTPATLIACGEAKSVAEDAIEALLDEAGVVTESDINAETPDHWDFLFGIELDSDQASWMDGEFTVGVAILEEYVSLPDIENQLIAAKVEELDNYGDRLWFTTKAGFDGATFRIDEQAQLFGDAAGSHGAGTYVFYHAHSRVGFIAGSATDCDGAPADGALVTATGSPFFSYVQGDGSYGLPIPNSNPLNSAEAGMAVSVAFETEDCGGSEDVGTGDDTNPKNDDLDEPAEEVSDHVEMDDGTDVQTPREETEMEEDREDIEEVTVEPKATEIILDFEGDDLHGCEIVSGSDGSDGSYANVSLETAGYDTMFAGGSQSQYVVLNSGGNYHATTDLACKFTVPSGATSITIVYNFLSQEYSEYVGSGYNDTFNARIANAPSHIIYRTVNNTADTDLWQIVTDDDLANLAGIGGGDKGANEPSSDDASYNTTGAVYDGMIIPDFAGDSIENYSVEEQGYDISAFAGQEVLLILRIADVGDSLWDSAVAIDMIHIQ